MAKKRRFIVGFLLLFAVLLIAVVFCCRYANNLHLLLEKCRVDTSEDVLQVIHEGEIDGKKSLVLMSKVLPSSELGAEDSYSVFLHCIKNDNGFWSLTGYSCINSANFNSFYWGYPLDSGQNEYHAVYCGIHSQSAESFDRFRSQLPEGISAQISFDSDTYLIHLHYTADQWMKLDVLELLEGSGIITYQAWAYMIPKDLVIEDLSQLSELEREAVIQKLLSVKGNAEKNYPAYKALISAVNSVMYRMGYSSHLSFDPRTYTEENTIPHTLIFILAVMLIPPLIGTLCTNRKSFGIFFTKTSDDTFDALFYPFTPEKSGRKR